MTEQTEQKDLSFTDNVRRNDISSNSIAKSINNSPVVQKLRGLLNKMLKIEMSDGRVLIGTFLCTDADANVILGSCSEYLPQELIQSKTNEEPRMLGLVMVPGKHIITVSKDLNDSQSSKTCSTSTYDFEEDVI
ncbi:hypothetical protein WA026_001771 [Henosepilachna vigintioctopunctata]|uniref:Sm domain-containing protein n=1 Tax=Henosepilachna vigintioctopunctata TaxID=420089 RepID=A0AAW1US42_9CUCU